MSDSSAQTRAQLESSRGVQAATDGELAELRTQHEALKGNIVTMTNELLGEMHGMHAVEDTVKQLSAQVEEHLNSKMPWQANVHHLRSSQGGRSNVISDDSVKRVASGCLE